MRELAEWLRDNFVTDSSPIVSYDELQALVRTCYKRRRGSTFDTLKCLAGQGQTHRLDFEQLYEFLGKLGQHVHIAKRLIEAAVSLSQEIQRLGCTQNCSSLTISIETDVLSWMTMTNTLGAANLHAICVMHISHTIRAATQSHHPIRSSIWDGGIQMSTPMLQLVERNRSRLC